MQRKWSLDILRIASMAAVVLLHTSAQFWADTDVHSFNWEVLNVYDSITRWSVPVFVMISGVLFLDPSRDQPIKKLFLKNILRILTILVFWGFAYAALYNPPVDWSSHSLAVFIKTWMLGHLHMWFLYMIIGLYIVTPILRYITRNQTITNYFLILAFVFNTALPFITSFGHFSIINQLIDKIQLHLPLGFTFYYVLGFWLNQRFHDKKYIPIAAFLAIGGVLLSIILTAFLSITSGTAQGIFYSNFSLPVCMASVGVFILGNRIVIHKESTKRIVTVLSRASLGVYMVHFAILHELHLIGFDSMMFTPILAVPITSIVAIALSFAISALLVKIPFINKYIV